jgi:hypothetical protein
LNVTHTLSFETVMDAVAVLINPRVEFFADPEKGTGTFDQLNFNFPVSKKVSILQVNETEYDDKILPHFHVTNGVVVNQVYSKVSYISYSWLFDSVDQANYYLNSYDVAVAWNHTILKGILYYQIVPHLDFSKTKSWKGVPGINFTLAMDF